MTQSVTFMSANTYTDKSCGSKKSLGPFYIDGDIPIGVPLLDGYCVKYLGKSVKASCVSMTVSLYSDDNCVKLSGTSTSQNGCVPDIFGTYSKAVCHTADDYFEIAADTQTLLCSKTIIKYAWPIMSCYGGGITSDKVDYIEFASVDNTCQKMGEAFFYHVNSCNVFSYDVNGVHIAFSYNIIKAPDTCTTVSNRRQLSVNCGCEDLRNLNWFGLSNVEEDLTRNVAVWHKNFKPILEIFDKILSDTHFVAIVASTLRVPGCEGYTPRSPHNIGHAIDFDLRSTKSGNLYKEEAIRNCYDNGVCPDGMSDLITALRKKIGVERLQYGVTKKKKDGTSISDSNHIGAIIPPSEFDKNITSISSQLMNLCVRSFCDLKATRYDGNCMCPTGVLANVISDPVITRRQLSTSMAFDQIYQNLSVLELEETYLTGLNNLTTFRSLHSFFIRLLNNDTAWVISGRDGSNVGVSGSCPQNQMMDSQDTCVDCPSGSFRESGQPFCVIPNHTMTQSSNLLLTLLVIITAIMI
jgi:hypothetical protein